MPRRSVFLALVLLVILQGCSTSAAITTPDTSSAADPVSSAAAAPAGGYYVSIGDSYAAGFKPTADGGHTTTTDGFAYQIVDLAKAAGTELGLFNVGCSGATSDQLMNTVGCVSGSLGPDAEPYPTVTEAQAALNFMNAHQGAISLVTVVIGGNDMNDCIKPEEGAFSTAVQWCLNQSVAALRTNLRTLLTQIRVAVGPTVPIVGLTYPDIYLGAYVTGNWQLASASLDLFKTNLNPALLAEYTAEGATFVDITESTGAYGSADDFTTLAPYGSIPVPVARVCELTYYCSNADLHPTEEGHALIAAAVVNAVVPGTVATSAPMTQ